ncbi:MAG: YceI family protein [Flavobacteriaceae bacterium]|nr:YceI family protein [Flavobacteriaceae bacterium]
MKSKILMLLVFFSVSFYAQEKYYTKSGTITFESSVPSFEEVKATNTKVTAILKDDGTIAALALTKAFRFKIALMEEHFNENYMESTRFPKATFSGEISNFSMDQLTSSDKEFRIKGKLTIRGVSKNIEIKSQIKKQENTITITSNFTATPEDFGIKIPNIVRNKIAKKVDISFNFVLKKK